MSDITDSQTAHGASPEAAAPGPRCTIGWLWREYLSFKRISAVYLLVVLIIIFSLWVPDTFLTLGDLKSILSEQAITALAAVALVLPLAAGVYDLSVGMTLGAGNINIWWLITNHSWSPVLAIVFALVFGIFVGVVNGGLVARAGLNSFIVTLGISSALTAYVIGVSGNTQIIGNSSTITDIASTQVLGISLAFFIMLAISLVLWYVMSFRVVGRHVYAVGGGMETARLAGVRVRAVILGSLIVCGLLAAVAGVLSASQVGIGDPTEGSSYLIPAFAAAFLGSTQLQRGRFNVWGTVLAVYVLAVGVKGFQLAGAPFWVADAFNAAALIFAVGLSKFEQQGSLAGMVGRLRRRPTSEPPQPPSGSTRVG